MAPVVPLPGAPGPPAGAPRAADAPNNDVPRADATRTDGAPRADAAQTKDAPRADAARTGGATPERPSGETGSARATPDGAVGTAPPRPPPAAVSVTTRATPPSPPQANALPPAIASLPQGAKISGVVVKGPDGMLLRTQAGIVRFETPLNLAPGSQVVVRVTGADARLTATVVSVDGRPPGGPPPQAVLSAPPTAPTMPATLVGPLTAASATPAPAAVNPPLLPPAIARLTTGSRVAGTIAIDRDTGAMVLQSRQGIIRLDGPRGLTAGSRVVLEVDTVAPRLVATLVSVNNRPPAGAAQSVVLTAAPAAAPPPQASVAPGSQITATVVEAAPARMAPNPPGGPLGGAIATSSGTIATPPGNETAPRPVMPPLGTSMTVTVRTIAVPGATPALAGSIAVPSAPAPATSPAAAPVPGSGPGPARPVSSGAATTPVTTPAATLGNVTVVGQDASGRTLARYPGGMLRLAVPAPLPAGATLALDVVAVSPSPPPPLALGPTLGPTAAQAPWPGFPHDWGTLRQSLDVIAATDPEAARGVLDKAIPNTRPSSSANLIALLLGLRMGNLRTWMGERALSVLESAGRTDLTRRLSDDVARAGRQMSEPMTGDWRAVLMPFHDTQQLYMIPIYYRERFGRGHDGENESQGTRMVIDIELSQLGALQLDGLFIDQRFELFIRAHESLPEEIRREIRTIFHDAMAEVGMRGDLVFQVRRDFPVAPAEEMARAAAEGAP